MKPTLGNLSQVDLRQIWTTEAGDFTPWLAQAENLALLGKVLGMELELDAQEKSVGPFRADILCRDVTDSSWVLIENQLERTDHTHLGQLLTYAAGLDAVTIVWVAERFTDEHRSALDWLNEKTPDGVAFFGLEVELWQIENSLVAPKFNIVCRPNEWTRTMIRNSVNTEQHQLCLGYWSGVIEALGPHGILTSNAKPVRKQDMSFPVHWHRFWLKSYFSRAEEKAGVWVSCRGTRGYSNYCQIFDAKDQVEATYGRPLSWEPDEQKNLGACTEIFSGYRPTDRSTWPKLHEFIAERLARLHAAVKPFVEELDLDDEEVTPG